MLLKYIKHAVGSVIEITIVVVTVLIFFCLFLLLLNFIFPSGASLKELMYQREIAASKGHSRSSSNELQIETVEGLTSVIAELADKENNVKAKRAGAVAWQSANRGMPFYNRDAIQTFYKSWARITLDRDNEINMGENSLIIIKSLEPDPFSGKKSVLEMTDGKLRGKIKGTKTNPFKMEINTPSSVTRVKSLEGTNSKANFMITVNPDKSSIVAVYEGIAEVAAQGKIVQIKKNEGIRINLGKVPSDPEPLLPPPVLSVPDEGDIFYYRDLPPRIRFAWNASTRAESYHLILARDPDFHQVIEDSNLSETSFIHGNLKEGEYYWGVSGIEGGREGWFGEVRKINIVKDCEAPILNVRFPDEMGRHSQDIILTGVTEPGASVFVQGIQVSTNKSGEFMATLHLKPGINLVEVESVDAAGNVAYQSQILSRGF